jgi:hypothetical protein
LKVRALFELPASKRESACSESQFTEQKGATQKSAISFGKDAFYETVKIGTDFIHLMQNDVFLMQRKRGDVS